MVDVVISKKNNVHIQLQCNESIHRELNETFTFLTPNAKYHPMVKQRIWDGRIRLYNRRTGTIYAGLYKNICDRLKELGYNVESTFEENSSITPEDVVEFCDELKPQSYKNGLLNFKDYQYAAVYLGLKHKRRVILSPTASGKSLIIYSLMRKILEEVEGKVLILVPLVNLVRQLNGDFHEYAHVEGFDVSSNCHQIMAGEDKDSSKRVYISTYQSIHKLSVDYFKQFDAVIVDETHKAKANSFKHILESCINAEYRIGLTGTLDEWEVNELVVQGLLGKVTRVASTADLIERGDLAKLGIKFYELQYPTSVKKELKFELYKDEIDWIIGYKPRNHFIQQLAEHLDGNVLILFQYVEKHGDVLNELITRKSNKQVHYIHGDIDVDLRDDAKAIVEETSNNIIIASYGTYSTGINIKNLHHIVLASTTKSVVRVLQSIGRGLRLGTDKTTCTLHDISDNLMKRTAENFALQHGYRRIEIYNQQKFDYEIIKVEL